VAGVFLACTKDVKTKEMSCGLLTENSTPRSMVSVTPMKNILLIATLLLSTPFTGLAQSAEETAPSTRVATSPELAASYVRAYEKLAKSVTGTSEHIRITYRKGGTTGTLDNVTKVEAEGGLIVATILVPGNPYFELKKVISAANIDLMEVVRK
jgi:hypothetical protein